MANTTNQNHNQKENIMTDQDRDTSAKLAADIDSWNRHHSWGTPHPAIEDLEERIQRKTNALHHYTDLYHKIHDDQLQCGEELARYEPFVHWRGLHHQASHILETITDIHYDLQSLCLKLYENNGNTNPADGVYVSPTMYPTVQLDSSIKPPTII